MRIIADRDKRDYYDCVQACAQDRTTLYVRREEEIYLERGQWPFPSLSYYTLPHLSDMYIIGFCGKIYPMIQMSAKGEGYGETIPVFCYSMEELDEFLKTAIKSDEWEYYLGKRKRTRWSGWRTWGSLSKQRNFVSFFENCKRDQDKHREMFVEKQCPVFVARESGRRGGAYLTWNALLEPLGFMRIFEPYTAFQEVQMFMNNMAVPQMPMPVIPDEIKAESKGFNKWSFRTPPAGI